jgi:hypothetical protein
MEDPNLSRVGEFILFEHTGSKKRPRQSSKGRAGSTAACSFPSALMMPSC